MSHTQRKTLSVREIAKKCQVTTRQIQRLANPPKGAKGAKREGIPGAELKKADGVHTVYHDTPALRQWIKNRRSKKKGKLPDGRRKVKEKEDLNAVSFPDRSIRRWRASLDAVCKNDPLSEWEIEDLLTLSFRLERATDIFFEIEELLHKRLHYEIFVRPNLVSYEEFSAGSERFRDLKDHLRKFISVRRMRNEEQVMPYPNEWDSYFRESEQKEKRKR